MATVSTKSKRSKASGFTLQVDTRTDKMSEAALTCRSLGHAWDRRPLTKPRRLELLTQGLTERVRVCLRCASVRTVVRRLPSYEEVSDSIVYANAHEYLVPKGTGRLARAEADKAMFVREMAELA